MTSDLNRAEEDAADEETRLSLERHVAMRLTAIIKMEEAAQRSQRNKIMALAALFVTATLIAIIFLVVQLQSQADAIESSNDANIKRSYNICLKRNEQSQIVTLLLSKYAENSVGGESLTPAQRLERARQVQSFSMAFVPVDCDVLLK